MVKHQTRLFVAMFVLVDVACTAVAWVLAYYLRFHSPAFLDLLPADKGVPELSRYLLLLPLIAVLWPAVLYFHGLYQVKRGRSRIDEFFAILFSVLIASALTLGATLYVRVYYRYQPEVAPDWEYSQAVFGAVHRRRRAAAQPRALRAAQPPAAHVGGRAQRAAGGGGGGGRPRPDGRGDPDGPPRAGLPRGRLPRRPRAPASAAACPCSAPSTRPWPCATRTGWTSSTSRCPSRTTPSC